MDIELEDNKQFISNIPRIFKLRKILEVDKHTHLGVTFSNTLSWSICINAVIAKLIDEQMSFADVRDYYQEAVKIFYTKLLFAQVR